jgi:RHS repeat-associated protein
VRVSANFKINQELGLFCLHLLQTSMVCNTLNWIKQLTKTTASLPKIVTTYCYDMVGNLSSLIDAETHQTSYFYNYNHQVNKITDAKLYDTIFTYSGSEGNGVDKLVGVYDASFTKNTPLANQPHTAFNYDKLNRLVYQTDQDDLNRLTAITHSVTGGAPIAAFNYPAYDMVDNRKSVSGSKAESYLYNELYRILTVTSAKPEAFNFDAVGNRQNGPGPTDTVYAHNNANQMTQGRKLGYAYDDFGNQNTRTVPVATDKSWVQTWDYQNRLVMVQKTKGTETRTVTFTYDPLGRRIGKQMTIVKDGVSQTQSWSYVYDGDSIAVEIYTDENNTTTNTYYTQGPGVDEHLALERNGQFYYYHVDGLGSVATITDATHAVAQSYYYDSYGMVTPANDFRNSYAYTGREWDKEAGLYYYRARYYDPIDGRFISKDPLTFGSGDVNLYGYVQNNPIDFTDPHGTDKFSTGLNVSGLIASIGTLLPPPIDVYSGYVLSGIIAAQVINTGYTVISEKGFDFGSGKDTALLTLDTAVLLATKSYPLTSALVGTAMLPLDGANTLWDGVNSFFPNVNKNGTTKGCGNKSHKYINIKQ